MTTTYQERRAREKARAEREQAVIGHLTNGLSTRAIAAELGVSQQSVQRFIARRGWSITAAGTERWAEQLDGELTDRIQKLFDQGVGVAEIAATVGRTEKMVKSRIKRDTVSALR